MHVLSGVRNGVATRMKAANPYLINFHCVNHKEALRVGQAANAVLYLKNTFKPNLGNLFRFYENSAVRMEGLKAVQALLDDPKLKLKDAKDVRWLSTDKACQSLRKILPSVIASLEHEGTERAEPVAIGLSRIISNYKLVYSLCMMWHSTPLQQAELSIASRKFGLASSAPPVASHQSQGFFCLEGPCRNPGETSRTLATRRAQGFQHHSPSECERNFC